jgi:hypothetical protein
MTSFASRQPVRISDIRRGAMIAGQILEKLLSSRRRLCQAAIAPKTVRMDSTPLAHSDRNETRALKNVGKTAVILRVDMTRSKKIMNAMSSCHDVETTRLLTFARHCSHREWW